MNRQPHRSRSPFKFIVDVVDGALDVVDDAFDAVDRGIDSVTGHTDRALGAVSDLLLGDNPADAWRRHPVTRRHSSRVSPGRTRYTSPSSHDKRSSERDSGHRRLSGERADRPMKQSKQADYSYSSRPSQPTAGRYSPSGADSYDARSNTSGKYPAYNQSPYVPTTFASETHSTSTVDNTEVYPESSDDETFLAAEATKAEQRRSKAAALASQRFGSAASEPPDPTVPTQVNPSFVYARSWERTRANPYPPGWNPRPDSRDTRESEY